MAGVVDEVKSKLAELDAMLEAIKSEQVALERDRKAFETVTACYDPSFRPSEMPALKRLGSSEAATPTKQVTALLNQSHLVLEILRQASNPIAAAEVAGSFIDREKLVVEVEGLGSHITSRFATVLNGLQKQ
ncbi:hypothetical protein HFO56_39425 [Rhizobium laguerreae]|uniref:hypothetical protein n=1 Tax=Rhizobium laguerreae TaxID=1076926 RepID=UPI001C915E96|nr:hypothetical protein [Rhizobium laguerreae]MBY3158373.1 hypothetical protein [Rhizobium laguerreae]